MRGVGWSLWRRLYAPIDTRVTSLEDTYVRAHWFESVSSGTSGTIAAPVTGATFVLDQWSAGVDALVSTVSSSMPTFISPVNSGGTVITATLDSAGAYVLSDTPTAYPVAVIFVYRCKFKYFDDSLSLFEAELENTDIAKNTAARHTQGTDTALGIIAGNITLSDDSWIGLGAAKGRIEFDDQATDEINFLDCNVGIGTASPDSIFHIKANVPGTVGSHPAGQLIIQDPDDTVFGNAVITGYESDGAGNPDQQLWYLGSSSSGNSDIIFLNRRNSNLHLGTNGVSRLTISGNGNHGFGATTFGTNAAGTIAFANGTAPSADVADQHAYYGADIAAGNAAPHFRTENGSVIKLYRVASYTPSNAGTDRSFDANAVSIHELADVVGSLIVDLQSLGVLG